MFAADSESAAKVAAVVVAAVVVAEIVLVAGLLHFANWVRPGRWRCCYLQPLALRQVP